MTRPTTLAVSAVVVRDDCLLMVKRGGSTATGSWAPPGGSVRPGESLAAAVRRELNEETGLTGHVGGLVATVIVDTGAERHLIVARHVEVPSGSPKAADDADAAAWVPIDEADTWNLAPGVESVVRLLLARRRR